MRWCWLFFLFVPLLSLQSSPVYAMGIPENAHIGSVSTPQKTIYSPQAIHAINQTIDNDVNSPTPARCQKAWALLKVPDIRASRAGEEELGGIYDNGCAPIHQNDKKAVYWLRKAAIRGSKEAEFGLGVAYGLGQGVPQDFNHADFWLMKAVHKGSSSAAYSLGSIYLGGLGVSKNLAKAFYWYHQSALLGSTAGAERTGTDYRYGLGVKKNDVKALYWWKKAAKGHANARKKAIVHLAYYYSSVPNFNPDMLRRYVLPAVKYSPYLAHYIAYAYQNGMPDFPQNKTKANYWWGVYASQYLHLLSTWPLNVLKPYILATVGWAPILFLHNRASDIGFGISFLLSCMILVWKRKSLYHTLHWVIPGFFIAFIWIYLSTTVITIVIDEEPNKIGIYMQSLFFYMIPCIGALMVIASRLRFSWFLSYPLIFFSVLLVGGGDVLHTLQLSHFNFHGYWYLIFTDTGIRESGGAGFTDLLFDMPLLALLYAFITMRVFKAIIRYRNRRSPHVST